MYSTDPTTRAAFIDGLRALADYLEANPELPVPTYGRDICIHLAGTDIEKRAQIQRFADLIDTRPDFGDHYTATRHFGPISYEFAAIPAAWTAEHEARNSYAPNIQTSAA